MHFLCFVPDEQLIYSHLYHMIAVSHYLYIWKYTTIPGCISRCTCKKNRPAAFSAAGAGVFYIRSAYISYLTCHSPSSFTVTSCQ